MTTLHSTSRITNFNHPGQPALDHAFGYDAVDRINQEVDNIGASLWTYDLNGNRLSSQPGAANYSYTYPSSSNRLQSVSGPVSKTYTYDAAGNPTSDGATAFTFNAAGRLSKVVRSGQTNQYYHNATGERVIKSGAYLTNGPYRFIYDESGKLIGEYDRNNSLRQEMVWLEDTPIAVLRKNAQGQYQTFYVHADHLNTPRAILDQQNRTVWKWNSNAFGQGLPEEDPDGDGQSFEYNSRYPGQYFDKETGLHYNYFRDYDPSSGRYPQADPIGLEGGTNVYGYARSNPLSLIDPEGLLFTTVHAFQRGMTTRQAMQASQVGNMGADVLGTSALLDVMNNKCLSSCMAAKMAACLPVQIGGAGIGTLVGGLAGVPMSPMTAGMSVPAGAALGGAGGWYVGGGICNELYQSCTDRCNKQCPADYLGPKKGK